MTRLTETIKSFPHADYTVIREPSGHYRKGKLIPSVEIAGAVTFDAVTNLVELAGHELVTGDGPLYFKTTDTLPDPIEPSGAAAVTPYYAIVVDAGHFKLAESKALALLGTAIDLTDTGTGTHTVQAPLTFTIEAGIQSLTGRGVNSKPEGESADESLLVFTESKLYPRLNGIPGYEPDAIVIDWFGAGEELWYVDRCEKFTAHYRATITRVSLP